MIQLVLFLSLLAPSLTWAAAFAPVTDALGFCAEHLTKGSERFQIDNAGVFTGYSVFKTGDTNIDSSTGYALKIATVQRKDSGWSIYWIPVDLEKLKAHPNEVFEIDDVQVRSFMIMEGGAPLAAVLEGTVGEVEITVKMKKERKQTVYEMTYSNFKQQ